MSLSEAKKKANKKWNDLHTKTFAVRISLEQYDKLKSYCELHDISIGSLIKDRIHDIID